jgi:hypothetical protein
MLQKRKKRPRLRRRQHLLKRLSRRLHQPLSPSRHHPHPLNLFLPLLS